MATWNGDDENLKFICGQGNCGEIVINPENKDDLLKLGPWLMQHSARGGKYVNVPIPKQPQKIKLDKELEDFAMEMQRVLNQHKAVKGNSWRNADLDYLKAKLLEEVSETMKVGSYRTELVDVANICMFIWTKRVEGGL